MVLDKSNCQNITIGNKYICAGGEIGKDSCYVRNFKIFLMLSPLVRRHYSTTFYRSYFSHHIMKAWYKGSVSLRWFGCSSCCSSYYLRKIVHTNLPPAGFELGSLGPQASILAIEPPLLVFLKITAILRYKLFCLWWK